MLVMFGADIFKSRRRLEAENHFSIIGSISL